MITAIEPVLAMVCDEPNGSVVRHVYPMYYTPENLKTFWEKASKYRTIFSADVNGDFKKFMETFVSQEGDTLRAHGLFYVIDDFVGVYYMTHIMEIEARVHYSFFDGRHKGRKELTKEMLRYAFRTFGFWRLNTEIPMYASKGTFGFVNAIGFTQEGRKRKAAEYDGTKFDVAIFGLLREEIL